MGTPPFHFGLITHTHPLLRALGADVFAPRLHQNTEFPSLVSLLPSLAGPHPHPQGKHNSILRWQER